jgi:hypothetical protein
MRTADDEQAVERQRSKVKLVLSRSLAAIAVVVLVWWPISIYKTIGYTHRTEEVAWGLAVGEWNSHLFVADGVLGMRRVRYDFLSSRLPIVERPIYQIPLWRPAFAIHGQDWNLTVPLWIIALATGMLSAILWPRRLKLRKGICQNCGYDLTGNASGICPECGTPCEVHKGGL